MSSHDSTSEPSVRVAITPQSRYGGGFSDEASRITSPTELDQAREFVHQLPGYAATPLLDELQLASECNVASVLIKHEGHRRPTKSFKVLGPPYALARQLLSRLNRPTRDLRELITGRLKSDACDFTACAATSGNHGRALAWAAGEFGCRCRIYMPDSTGSFREEQIRLFGAEVVRVPGTYDDAVNRAVADSEQHGFILVGDGAGRDDEVLRHIIHGYAVVGDELVTAMTSGLMPTHVFIPAGSGSLAAAVTARLWMAFGANRPRIVVVQPHEADSGYQSCQRNSRIASQGNLATIMDGLSVKELSPDAWSILSAGAFAFIAIDDAPALATLARLTRDGRELTIGETGIAALAGLHAAASDSVSRRQLDVNEDSRVIVVATEGVTDPGVVNTLLDRAAD